MPVITLSYSELQALLELVGRAPKTQAEHRFVESVMANANRQIHQSQVEAQIAQQQAAEAAED